MERQLARPPAIPQVRRKYAYYPGNFINPLERPVTEHRLSRALRNDREESKER